MKNSVYDFLTRPKFLIFRHLMFIGVLIPIALAQAFFVFGNVPGVSERMIYQFGLGFAAVLLAFSYFNRFILTPRLLLKDRYTAFLSIVWLALFVLVGLKYHVEQLWIGSDALVNGITVLDWASNGTLYSICIASSSAPLLFRRWIDDQEQIEDLEKERLAYELEDYKNRINPQLIQTSILYAARRVEREPHQVTIFLQKLSETLRYQLYDYQRDQVLLASEVQFLKDVIALHEQINAKHYDLSVRIEGDANRLISPGLLLPLVEPVLGLGCGGVFLHIDVISRGGVAFRMESDSGDLTTCDLTLLIQRLTFLALTYRLNKESDHLTLQLC